MRLVDASVWIELLSRQLGLRISEEELVNFAACEPID